MDFETLASELVRVLRGKRSQAQFSRALGYRSNVAFDWESGRRFPSAELIFRMAERSGIDVAARLSAFHRGGLTWPNALRRSSPEAITRFMSELRGTQSIQELAQAGAGSRFMISRWLRGHSLPRLPEFLRYVQISSLRLLDFLAVFVDPHVLPQISKAWTQLSLARDLAYQAPWSHAVLRVLESERYRHLPRHVPGFIAKELSIEPAEERRCLDMLCQVGQVQLRRGRYRALEHATVDTRHDPVRSRQLRAFWARVTADRLEQGAPGEYAFNLFGVSNADLKRLYTLQRDYFQQLRAIVAQSAPVEQVVLLNVHLVPLSGARPQ